MWNISQTNGRKNKNREICGNKFMGAIPYNNNLFWTAFSNLHVIRINLGELLLCNKLLDQKKWKAIRIHGKARTIQLVAIHLSDCFPLLCKTYCKFHGIFLRKYGVLGFIGDCINDSMGDRRGDSLFSGQGEEN